MRTNLITGCISTSGGGLFYFGATALVLVNAYIIYKTKFEEGKVKNMSNYEFRRLVCLGEY